MIYGLQFAVDQRATYGIRVVNLSLESTSPQSATTDPLDAAVEQAWLHGLVVVAAAGNRGTAADAVSYAPGNDPYAISIGAVDDLGTKNVQGRRARFMVESRHDAGRRAQARRARPGRASRQHARARQRLHVAVPRVRRERPVHPSRRHLDGRRRHLRRRRRPAPGPPDMDPGPGQGRADRHRHAPSRAARRSRPTWPSRRTPPTSPTPTSDCTPNTLLDPATGDIDYTRASWSRASWSTAADPLRASWSRASWSCACSLTPTGEIDPARAILEQGELEHGVG